MKKLFDHLVTSKVTPNGLYILHATYNNYSYPKYVNFKHEQHRLELTGHLKSSVEKGVTVYKLTTEGLHLIRESEKILGKLKLEKSKPKVPFSEWEEQIVKFNKMFPAGKKAGSTVYFRTSPKELFSRFKWFFLEYPEYTWDDVMTATTKYVTTYENEGGDYTYMQTSKYFIKKDDQNRNTTSNLATLCYNIANNIAGDIDDGMHYFGP